MAELTIADDLGTSRCCAYRVVCLDVAYDSMAAAVAGALIRSWDAQDASQMRVRRFDRPPASYESGAFYKRELPLLLSLISGFDEPFEALLIDGYVWLDANHLPGLGGHLFSSLAQSIPVIGIAKTRYRNDTWSIPVLRGESQRPLFVTSAGIQARKAAECVRRMHGDYRIPTILNLVDRAARDGLARHD
jgi:deoxyribonuclease V